MSIKNLLVAFNEGQSSQNALQAALLMQKKYDTHLTGLLVHYGDRDKFIGENWVPADLREKIEDGLHAQETAVELMFRRACEGQVPADKCHWIAMSGSPDETVAKHAVMYDLTVVGQHSSDANAAIDLYPERIAIQSARPVLVVPNTYDPDSIDRPAVIAWDGRKAGTRVLHDAVQMLETKSEVHVISFGEAVHRPENAIEVITSLERHGVNALRINLPRKTRRFGEEILDYCQKINAGTLVMGVYEKGIFKREMIAGASQHVLEHADIPVLISN